MVDTYTKEIYKIGSGFGYKILCNSIVENDQPHAPGMPGIIYMTELEANTNADNVINQKVNPPVRTTIITFTKKLSDIELTDTKTNWTLLV